MKKSFVILLLNFFLMTPFSLMAANSLYPLHCGQYSGTILIDFGSDLQNDKTVTLTLNSDSLSKSSATLNWDRPKTNHLTNLQWVTGEFELTRRLKVNSFEGKLKNDVTHLALGYDKIIQETLTLIKETECLK
jgi:hypothetical protein